jgi:hypothetical protein
MAIKNGTAMQWIAQAIDKDAPTESMELRGKGRETLFTSKPPLRDKKTKGLNFPKDPLVIEFS